MSKVIKYLEDKKAKQEDENEIICRRNILSSRLINSPKNLNNITKRLLMNVISNNKTEITHLTRLYKINREERVKVLYWRNWKKVHQKDK